MSKKTRYVSYDYDRNKDTLSIYLQEVSDEELFMASSYSGWEGIELLYIENLDRPIAVIIYNASEYIEDRQYALDMFSLDIDISEIIRKARRKHERVRC